jgi:hypothetical protein
MRVAAEGGKALLKVVTGSADQQAAQGRMDVMRTVAWTAGRAVVVSGCLECWNVGRNDQSVGFAKCSVEILTNPTCRGIAQLGHQVKAPGWIQFPEVVDAPVVGIPHVGFGSPATAGISPAVMPEQHGAPVQPDHAVILKVMQVGCGVAEPPDLPLCGIERGSIKVMIAKDHIERPRGASVGERFQMLHKCIRGGGVAGNHGGVIIGVFEIKKQFAAVS